MINTTEEKLQVAGAELVMVRGGSGKPLLILHDELGYPGWMTWNESLAHERSLLIPLQPGFGKTPRIDWITNYRDLGGFYSQVLRELRLDPIDVIGFSAGGFIAAEMAAADPRIFSKMVLVAPMGLKPREGEIMDIFPVTIRTHLRATVADPYETPEFLKLYGGEMTPAQFEAFEDARAETARIAWEPYMHNPSLGHLLRGNRTPALLVWGSSDHVVPRGCIDAYQAALPEARVAVIEKVGHRPEIENSTEFERVVRQFLA
ncbi:MAG TPA: alpha/beta fold hydrolase [Candidatus Binataceae bacterium]|nr:alpha/beta fold hydrolase [Candidatus Binataceae bacterium]